MSGKYNFVSSDYESLKTASKKMFKFISRRLNVNTAYVTKKGEDEMTVLSSFNDREQIIPEGYSVEYGGTYCRLIISNEDSAMHTVNLTKDALTKELEVTSQLEVKGFLGVTLTDTKGDVFGTLCVMDKDEREFNEEDIDYLKSMAEILSYNIELDQTKYNMAFLTVPIIPISKGISILSIQGLVDESRADKIIHTVLSYGADNQIDYFIIDMSGLIILDGEFPKELIDLVQSLQVMGIETIITGITPEIARYEVNNVELFKLKAKTVPNLESALEYIGFYLKEKD